MIKTTPDNWTQLLKVITAKPTAKLFAIEGDAQKDQTIPAPPDFQALPLDGAHVNMAPGHTSAYFKELSIPQIPEAIKAVAQTTKNGTYTIVIGEIKTCAWGMEIAPTWQQQPL